MKKLLTVLLTLCLLASLFACFAISANAAEEVDVVVGSKFEWNDQSDAAAKWRNGKGKSEDGLWQYHLYRLEAAEGQNPYHPLVWSTAGCYAWNRGVGSDDGGIGYARVRNNGTAFHPATKADVVKTFYCPSGGTIEITSVLARESEVDISTAANGSSFAIYVEDRLVYPEAGNGDYLILESTTAQTVTVKDIEVAKNERVRIHIGSLGEQSADLVFMSNTIRYTGVNDSVVDEQVDTVTKNTYTPPSDVVVPGLNNNNNNNGGSGSSNNGQGGGLSTGAIIGIVAGGVAVIGIAVAVIVILKKKQQQ